MSFYCFFLCVSTVFAAEDKVEVVLYGDDSYPPYSYIVDGESEGIYCRILKLAAQRIEGYDVRVALVPYKRALEEAKQGYIFAIFPPYSHPIKRPYLSEYSVPLLIEETVVYCGETVMPFPNERWPDDYFGLTIGNNDGFVIGGDKLLLAAKQGKIKIESYKGTEVNLRKLMVGRVDCYINDRVSILWTLKRLDESELPYSRELAEGATIRQEEAYVAFSRKFNAPYRHDFIDKLNSVILDMRESGEIQRIVDSFLQ